ncbi:MAG TPA: zinc-ribbon domain containing protein [Peptococcaceae bacterium]|jgi:CxxC-x17-CxxC domain-containing protein|nr:zinc-binding protein [Clostridia bacterium]HOB81374.1 zinc-ribbon domain containing protein [Peptococcaceae bacterium]HPZ71573.1 zinc-ribbon domain containing protein [Peptococcaceae bacterium]HQD54540.1 zinc-ribbon domain containing protein [Peptococcaceae bacterium]
MEDKTIVCRDCGKEFIFSAQEQEFFAEKGFQNEPARCLPCRRLRKQQANKGERQFHTVFCSNCGVETQVPFKPTGIKPVYCRDCFQKMK